MKIKEIMKGFTLIEFLVIVAIVGILAAMILPALKKAREKHNKETEAEKAEVNEQEVDDYIIKTIEYDGHQFIVVEKRYGKGSTLSITPHPNCPRCN